MSDLKVLMPKHMNEQQLAKVIRRRNEKAHYIKIAEANAESQRLWLEKAAQHASRIAAEKARAEEIFALARKVAELGRKHEFAGWDAHYVKVYELREKTRWFQGPVVASRKDTIVRLVTQFNGHGLWVDINGNLLRSRDQGVGGYLKGMCRTQISSDGVIRTVDGFSIYIDGILADTIADLQKHLQHIIDSYQKRGK